MSTATPPGFLQRLNAIDRRWIFLAMALAVAGPIIWVGITKKTFPESARLPVKGAFATIQNAPANAKVLVSFDFDPASAGELQPMATAIIHHCAERGHKLYCMTLWAPGSPLIDSTLTAVVRNHYGSKYVYGENFVNLGFQAGNEGVMKLVNTNFPKAFPTDGKGTPVDQIPMMKGIERVTDFDVLVSISAGYPGAKEWVQYCVSTALTGGKPLKFVAGSTGVQTPQLMPYFPVQMSGILGAIKGAAEYEFLVNENIMQADGGKPIAPEFMEAQRRMAPQLVAHVLMVLLIILGNVIFFTTRKRGATA
ncbi:MAG: hypothetical protein JNK53_01325 [Phycisphaerae bacterium]|nr:hypothetical protein [Phycisphaerae bacterium]